MWPWEDQRHMRGDRDIRADPHTMSRRDPEHVVMTQKTVAHACPLSQPWQTVHAAQQHCLLFLTDTLLALRSRAACSQLPSAHSHSQALFHMSTATRCSGAAPRACASVCTARMPRSSCSTRVP